MAEALSERRVARKCRGPARGAGRGDGNPDFHLGISSDLQWKNFTVYALLDLQVGGQVYNRTEQRMYQYFRSADVDQVGKPDSVKKPVDYYFALYSGNNVNSWFVEPGGFLKLRELAVRYRVPLSALQRLRPLGVRGLGCMDLELKNVRVDADNRGSEELSFGKS